MIQIPVKTNFLAIDPGARAGGGTGIAIFNSHYDKPQGFIQLNPFKETDDKIGNLIDNIADWLKWNYSLPLTKFDVYIEEPEYWDSFKGQTAASSQSLKKLIFFYGRLYQLCVSLGHEVFPVSVQKWKGQLTKKQVQQRVKKITGDVIKGDVCDAVGIGLYLKGLL